MDGPGPCEVLLRRTRAKNPSLRPLPPLLTELACTQPSQVRAPPPGPPSSPSPCAGARLTAHGPVGRCEEPPPPLCNAGSRGTRRHCRQRLSFGARCLSCPPTLTDSSPSHRLLPVGTCEELPPPPPQSAKCDRVVLQMHGYAATCGHAAASCACTCLSHA